MEERCVWLVREELRGVLVPRTGVWRTLYVEDVNPYYLYRVLLGPGDFAERLEFCSWLNARYELRRYISFTDEAQINRDRLHNAVPTCGQMGLLTVPWKVTCSSG